MKWYYVEVRTAYSSYTIYANEDNVKEKVFDKIDRHNAHGDNSIMNKAELITQRAFESVDDFLKYTFGRIIKVVLKGGMTTHKLRLMASQVNRMIAIMEEYNIYWEDLEGVNDELIYLISTLGDLK